MTQRETLEQFHAQLMTMVTALDAVPRTPGCDGRVFARLGDACDGVMVAAVAIKSALRLKLPDEAVAAR